MIQDQRIIWDDDGTEKDLSLALSDFRTDSETIAFVSADDYIYLASWLPFNHRWFEVSSANDQNAAPTADIWWGNAWYPAVDIIDQTANGAVTLAQSGILEWKTDRLRGWECEQDSEDVDGVDSVGVYNMYWLRLGFDADLAGTTALKYIGHKFADDTILYTYYPDLNNATMKGAFASGKTNWDDQHFMAAEIIIRDLKRRNIAVSGNQIMDYKVFEEPGAHKVAELVYQGMGRAYDADRQRAHARYKEAMNLKRFAVDLNQDGNLNTGERLDNIGYMTR